MKKLNNHGMSIVEIVLTFTLIMILVSGMLVIVVNYRTKVSISLERLKMDTFKNNLTQDIYNDILTLGLAEINNEGECATLSLNRCINLVFQDGSEKAFGTSKVLANNKDSVVNKYLYYDGIKYKLKDDIPNTTLPSGRTYLDLQAINIMDDNIFDSTYTVLEDGTKVYLYSINVEISHVDFKEDFGIHILASTDDISM